MLIFSPVRDIFGVFFFYYKYTSLSILITSGLDTLISRLYEIILG